MNDLVILGIVLSGIIVALFIWQHLEHKKSTMELKMFQMENTRLIQQMSKSMDQLNKSMEHMSKSMEQMERESQIRHEENMTYFQGIMQSIARIIRKQEESEGPQ